MPEIEGAKTVRVAVTGAAGVQEFATHFCPITLPTDKTDKKKDGFLSIVSFDFLTSDCYNTDNIVICDW